MIREECWCKRLFSERERSRRFNTVWRVKQNLDSGLICCWFIPVLVDIPDRKKGWTCCL